MTEGQITLLLELQRDAIPFLSQFFASAIPIIFVNLSVMVGFGLIAFLLRTFYKAVGLRADFVPGFSSNEK